MTAASENLLIEHFEPYLGQMFQFGDTPYAFPLASIKTSDQTAPDWMKRKPFTLIFRAPRRPEWLPEGFYRCNVEDGTSFDIYVAPIQTPHPEFQDYQAVFN